MLPEHETTTDFERGVRFPNNGTLDAPNAVLGYAVHFEDENWFGYTYCPDCVLGIEDTDKCKCDPNDRDAYCIRIHDCAPTIKIRALERVGRGTTCVSCGEHVWRGDMG